MVMSVGRAGCSIATLLRWPTKRNYWTPALGRQHSQRSKHLAEPMQVQTMSSMIIMLLQQNKCMICHIVYVTVI